MGFPVVDGASSRAIGPSDSFDVDYKCIRNCGKVLIADLITKAGKPLVKQWINSTTYIGVLLICSKKNTNRKLLYALPSLITKILRFQFINV